MKKAVLIYSGTPMIGRSVIRPSAIGGIFNVANPQKYVKKVSEIIQSKGLDWSFELDQTETDLEELMKQQIELLVFLPELEKKVDLASFPKEKCIYLNSLAFHEYVCSSVLAFMEKEE